MQTGEERPEALTIKSVATYNLKVNQERKQQSEKQRKVL